jgi:hypothetical protein
VKKKWLILLIALLGCSTLLYFFSPSFGWGKCFRTTHLCTKEPYFEAIQITRSSAQIPCLEVEIAGKRITAKIDLGSCGDITLPSEFLKELDQKSFLRSKSYYGIRGKKYVSDIYELPKIKIGKMALYRPKAEEINLEFVKDATLREDEKNSSVENLGRLGWALFFNCNIFLDCEHSTIAFCDSLDTLKKQGYPVDAFIETPLLLDRNLIEFEAMSETGPLRCMLDTGSTLNILNKDVEGGCNDHMVLNPGNVDQQTVLNSKNADQPFDSEDSYDMPVFKIGKKDFGGMTFQKFKTPLQIDAIIGMEFLNSKLIFIDFPKRKIYFYSKKIT